MLFKFHFEQNRETCLIKVKSLSPKAILVKLQAVVEEKPSFTFFLPVLWKKTSADIATVGFSLSKTASLINSH